MSFEAAVFYLFAAILVYAGVRTITCRNPVHAALHLVLAFFTAAAIWLVLRAEFLAITLVLVYVGAVMVLFLFVVMMLDINLDRLREGFWSYLPLAAVVGALAVEAIVRALLARPKNRLAPNAVPEKGMRSLVYLGLLGLLDGLPILGLWLTKANSP